MMYSLAVKRFQIGPNERLTLEMGVPRGNFWYEKDTGFHRGKLWVRTKTYVFETTAGLFYTSQEDSKYDQIMDLGWQMLLRSMPWYCRIFYRRKNIQRG